jgi:hypothetical protein
MFLKYGTSGGTEIRDRGECSKKSVQQGRSPLDERSLPSVREHGKMARTPLAAFFNIPIRRGVNPAWIREFD